MRALLGLVAVGACWGCVETTDGCTAHPQSQRVVVGEPAAVEVRFVGGGFDTLDFAGDFWDTEASVPPSAPQNGSFDATAVLLREETDDQSAMAEVVIDGIGTFEFHGPIPCH